MYTCRADRTKQSIDPQTTLSLLGPDGCGAVGGKWCPAPRCAGTAPKSKPNHNSDPPLQRRGRQNPRWSASAHQRPSLIDGCSVRPPDRIARRSFRTGLGNNQK
uniref:Uncharacterized protein n=1 Tax=Eutreptiella gymnastica TaxID=73025 RepID=A0A7S4CYR7_9EUGL